MTETVDATDSHSHEPHDDLGGKLNWLRAGVLGANDGIVSVAGIVVGVAGATTSRTAILTAGIAGLVAGAFSMAGGEYVSVSTQRDTERALLQLEKQELKAMPEAEERELAEIYEGKGLSRELAAEVARELTRKDAFHAHAEAELGIDPDNLTNPWQAAWASLIAFSVGALLPLLSIAWTAVPERVWACALAVVVGVGALTMLVTYFVGVLFGTTIG